ncbi:putative membrane protein [bacterium HR17]|uniref:Putative membrane protein n=1 Tax=Candidatus Fervidibacter japonicus TaxID=2035412 RepID=A0A2H5XCF8_9BACT|nr:putative membrane protein [bacterium HR17]
MSITEFFQRLLDVEALIRWGGLTGIVVIVFVETGLFIGFFLPGDSLLVTAGIMAAAGYLDLRWLIPLTILAAIIGDQVNYAIGYRAGMALMNRYERFRPHLERAHAFYEKHGAKTIVLARFVPIVRTFAPAIAGAARMDYRTFVTYNIVGGIIWVLSTTLTGYTLGNLIPHIDRYLHIVIGIVVLLSVLPILREWWKERHKAEVR